MKMMEARMHPVFTAHAEEVERLMKVNGGYMERYRARGETDSDDFRLMARVQRRCSELLMSPVPPVSNRPPCLCPLSGPLSGDIMRISITGMLLRNNDVYDASH